MARFPSAPYGSNRSEARKIRLATCKSFACILFNQGQEGMNLPKYLKYRVIEVMESMWLIETIGGNNELITCYNTYDPSILGLEILVE